MDNSTANKKITIALVTDTLFDTNGVSRFIQDMLHHAPKCNASLYAIVASRHKIPLPSKNIISLKPFIAIPMPFYKEQSLQVAPPFLSLYRAIRRVDPDIIHISTPGPLGWSALLIAKVLGIGVAGTYHTDFPAFLEENTGSKTVASVATWFMRRFYKRMSFTFARSKKYMHIIQNDIGINREKILFLNSGTDTKRFNPLFRQNNLWHDFGVPQDSVVLLYVGRLNVEKNLLFLIDRYRELRQGCDEKIALVLVGEGEYAKYAKEWIEEDIYYLGVKRGEELSQIYASADIFVSASNTETLGQTVMEAQASGICAVVSDQGGVTESVEDGVSGYAISTNDPELWVDRLKLLILDSCLRMQMGEAGHKAMQQHSIQESCRRFVAQHRKALSI
jgi:glycosyltransferase involved in cell wall biosynthesis